MLIQKLLGRNRVEEYCFIRFKDGKNIEVTLALFCGHGIYQDLLSYKEIYFTEILNKEKLIMYADVHKQFISKKEALKLAKPYFEEFEAEVIRNREELNDC